MEAGCVFQSRALSGVEVEMDRPSEVRLNGLHCFSGDRAIRCEQFEQHFSETALPQVAAIGQGCSGRQKEAREFRCRIAQMRRAVTTARRQIRRCRK